MGSGQKSRGIRAVLRGALCLAALGTAVLAFSGEAAAAGKPGLRVQESPFRVTVMSASGRPLLKTVSGDFKAGGVRYGGLGFSVGPDPELAAPVIGVEVPAGEAQSVPELYLAKRLIRVRKKDGAIRAVFATDDPEGRTLSLELDSAGRGLLRLRAEVTPSKGVGAISAGFVTPRSEAFHGFGGRREGTDLRGLNMKT